MRYPTGIAPQQVINSISLKVLSMIKGLMNQDFEKEPGGVRAWAADLPSCYGDLRNTIYNKHNREINNMSSCCLLAV